MSGNATNQELRGESIGQDLVCHLFPSDVYHGLIQVSVLLVKIWREGAILVSRILNCLAGYRVLSGITKFHFRLIVAVFIAYRLREPSAIVWHFIHRQTLITPAGRATVLSKITRSAVDHPWDGEITDEQQRRNNCCKPTA